MDFISNLVNGISLGSIYAIIALGYTMVYGIAKMLNFAHGDIIMVGAYVCFYAVYKFSLPGWLGILLAMVICLILGVTVEKLAYKPLRKADSLAVLITAIGVSYFLENIAQLAFGANTVFFPNMFEAEPIRLFNGGVTVSLVSLVSICVCLLVMMILTLFVNRTKLGKSMRACSEDKEAATLMGISVNRTISMTFAIGSALAALAGVLLCSAIPSLSPTTGSMPGIKAFTAAVFGGIGSIPGAFIGGLLLGVIEILSKACISTQISDAIVFLVLIIVLLVRPTGILGRKIQEKV